MDKSTERLVILILVIILVLAGLSGCVSKQVATQPETTKERIDDSGGITGVSNVPMIVNALTCMFSPDSCDSARQEREMDR
tara:strand:- start:311 stop:553 length:243 start_codon:yes stop_codon:yes gene_type:complete